MIFEKLTCKLQHLLPHHLLSRLVANFADSKNPFIKNNLINLFIKSFQINLNEAQSTNLDDYATFNDFFTRALKSDARPIASDFDAIVSPADGYVIQTGSITTGQLIQAKSTQFKLLDLVGDEHIANHYYDGNFFTVYLSPKDYHRVHMPLDGTLKKTVYIPGKLFSVNYQSVQHIPNLFCRNERLVCIFDTPIGDVAVILVGAMLVAGIETVWGAQETPCGSGKIVVKDYAARNITLSKGAELGRFKYGSTVILLFGPKKVELNSFRENQPIKMGELVARMVNKAETNGSI